MPSKSKAQERFMRAAAHDKGFAKKADIPQSTARDFVRADQAAGNRKLPARVSSSTSKK